MTYEEKLAAMVAAEKRAKVLRAIAVADTGEIGIALYNEDNELSALFTVKCDPGKTGEEMLEAANEMFPVFVSKYKSKLDMESLGIAKVKFDNAVLGWKKIKKRNPASGHIVC